MKLLSEKRFDEVKELFIKYDVGLSSYSDIMLYANAFEIISEFTHHKLTTTDIFHAYDFISDVALNKRMDIIAHVAKEDRIRVMVRMLEECPETKGKLTVEEKVAFAYCVNLGECTRILDEEAGMTHNGIVLFDSFEHIKAEFEYEKAEFPKRFVIADCPTRFDETYGYSMDNPINATSVRTSYLYLNSLRYQGKKIEYKRICSSKNNCGKIIDKYDIYAKKGLFKNKSVKVATIYINSYCDEMPKVAPKGFTLV